MTSLLVLCCFSLLLAGVFGADVTVTVMKGNSVTLPINAGEIKTAEYLLWGFENITIATIDLEEKDSLPEYPNGRFRGRLNLDRNTGSLTINNITTINTGVYQLEIKTSSTPDYKPLKTFSVTVNDEPNTVSVIKGDLVTLPTGVKIQPDAVKWKFEGKIIAGLTDSTITNINVNPQTGDLNIRLDQSGKYEVEISGKGFIIIKIFRVNINEVKSVSGVKGGSVSMQTNTQTQGDDVIEWRFKNTTIAKVDRTKHPHPDHVLDKRFRDRLHVDWDGSLIIRIIETKDTGLFDVYLNAANRFIHKKFSLVVTESSYTLPKSHQVKIGPGFFVVVIMLVIALFMPITGDD